MRFSEEISSERPRCTGGPRPPVCLPDFLTRLHGVPHPENLPYPQVVPAGQSALRQASARKSPRRRGDSRPGAQRDPARANALRSLAVDVQLFINLPHLIRMEPCACSSLASCVGVLPAIGRRSLSSRRVPAAAAKLDPIAISFCLRTGYPRPSL